MPQNGWTQHEEYVLKELERLSKQIEKIDENLIKVGKDIVTLKIKASLWGAVAGSLPALATALMYFLRH